MIGCLYVPNGNPVRSEKFGFKLRWLERLIAHAAELLATGAPIVLAGDYNVMSTELDVYKPERWVNDALFRAEVREAFRRLVAQGWTDALRTLHPGERIYTFWDYFRNAYARDAGLRIDHLLLSPSVAARLKAAGVDRAVRGWERPAITRRSGSSLRTGRPRGRSKAGGELHGRRDKVGLGQNQFGDRFRPRLCENTANFCDWPSSAKFFAIFLLLNDLRGSKKRTK